VRGLADLDAVTVDANGTLLELVDPVPRLVRILREHGVERLPDAVRRAFHVEGAMYAARAAAPHEPEAFAALQRECVGLFLAEVEAREIDAGIFTPLYVGAMEFQPLAGVDATLARLRRSGLELAVVANFDVTLRERLDALGLASWFSAIVTPVDAGVAKPDRRIFDLALERLGVEADRALHIGDGAVDEEGATAAGMHFEWAPLQRALERRTG
jgi:putative hydrolase of the HAD superfamily